MMREAQKMMQDPAFQAHTKKMQQNKAFQDSIKKTQEVFKDPKKLKEMEKKVKASINEGTKQLEAVKKEGRSQDGTMKEDVTEDVPDLKLN
jgi:ABC-type dipeptide/oligopeptide/nickel transport system ATPase subunit